MTRFTTRPRPRSLPPSRRSLLLSRRTILAGGGGLGLAAFLAACSNDSGGSSTDGLGENVEFEWPSYVPFEGPEPDLPGTEDGVNPGFLTYPALADLVATHAAPPGDGQPVTAMTPLTGETRPTMDVNTWWQHLNGKLGSPLDLQLVPISDYQNVFQTTTASGAMPDLFTIYSAPRLPEMLEQMAVDLTDYVAGGAIEAYPNLANIPTAAWQACTYNGRIRTLPLWRGIRTSTLLYQRTDILTDLGLPTEYADFEEFLEVAKEVTDPAQGRWAFSNPPSDFIRQSLGIGKSWLLEGDTVVSAWADERQEEFFEAGRRIMEAGLVHPDGFTGTNYKERLVAGQAVFLDDSVSAWGGLYTRSAGLENADTFAVDGVRVFNFAEGYTGAPWRHTDVNEQCGVGISAESRIETVLAVADFLAAPIGSQEKLAASYGEEGVHFTMVDDYPERTETGTAEWLNLGLLMNGPFEIEQPGYPQAVTDQHAFQTYLADNAVRSIADGLYVESLVSEGAALELTMEDTTNEILQGRADPAGWSAAVDDFLLNGGEEIAADIASAYQAAKS